MKLQQLDKIPLDKKKLRFCSHLEVINQTSRIERFLMDNWHMLNDDGKFIYISLVNRYNYRIPVGDYGGLYEGLKYLYGSHLGIEKQFILGRQLQGRPEIDGTSSKLQSTKVLLGDAHTGFENYFVDLADEVRVAWNKNKITLKYLRTPDANILTVMKFVLDGKDFSATNSELAVSKAILDEKSTNKIILENPQFKAHEEDRTKTILRTLKEYHDNKVITTTDHRQAWSVVCKGYLEDRKVELKHPQVITKSFPNFWEIFN